MGQLGTQLSDNLHEKSHYPKVPSTRFSWYFGTWYPSFDIEFSFENLKRKAEKFKN